MDKEQAIETLRANYPDACYEQLREAVDAAIEALKAQDAAGDTISRQAAIDAVDKYDFNIPEYMEGFVTKLRDAMKEDLREDIAGLPSVQPEYRLDEWCMDCKEYDQEKHCCPRFNRVIREAAEEVRQNAQPEPSIPLSWIENEIKWLKSLDNTFSEVTALQISVMVKKWRDEQNETD